MKLISRSEEMALLAILQLQDNAYGVTIQEELKRLSGRTWAFGALFVTLDRMAKKGLEPRTIQILSISEEKDLSSIMA